MALPVIHPTSVIIYLLQMLFVSGWLYFLLMGLLLFATLSFLICIFIGVMDNCRKTGTEVSVNQ